MTSWLPSQIEEREEEEVGPLAERRRQSSPPWATPRILAQRGRFTIHGTGRVPIEECFANAGDEERRGHLASITLTHPGSMAKELGRLGFAVHRLFPEPEKRAQHLRAMG